MNFNFFTCNNANKHCKIPTWFSYRLVVKVFPDNDVKTDPSWIMGEITMPLVTWNFKVSARALGSVFNWSSTLCGTLANAASVGAKIVKGVAVIQNQIKELLLNTEFSSFLYNDVHDLKIFNF